MICASVTVRVHPGKAARYEAMCRQMLAAVRAGEPGVIFFDIGSCRDKPDCFKVIEIYRDKEALTAHYETPHWIANKPIMDDCIADISVERYDSFA